MYLYTICMLLIFLIQAILRIVAYPFFLFFYLLRIGPFYRRVSFESKNYQDEGTRAFSRVGKKAHCLFHFSSEGEFEQIRPIIDELISHGKNVELLFTSPSVEHKVVEYYQAHRERVRYLRLPLITYFPLLKRQNIIAWSSASKMMMVRYDFFPELIYLGSKMSEFILFSATSKSSKARFSKDGKPIISWIKKFIYAQFSEVIAATIEDQKVFESAQLGTQIVAPIELRMLQINSRQKSFRKHKHYEFLSQILGLYPYQDRICLAQMWINEFTFFNDTNLLNDIADKKKFVFLAPHLLKEDKVEEMLSEIKKLSPKLKIHILDESKLTLESFQSFLKEITMNPGLILCTVKGILCEIYPYFHKVYVGGGHGKGVHSLLEPFVAGSRIFCGPNIHRSTEYDMIISSNFNIKIIEECHEIYHIMSQVNEDSMKPEVISAMIEESELAKRKLINLLTK